MEKRARKHRGLEKMASGSWRVCYFDGNKKVRKVIGSFEDAKSYLYEIHRRKRAGEVLPDSQGRRMGDLLDLYLDRAENVDSRKAAEFWRQAVGHLRISELTEDALRSWVRDSRRNVVELTQLATTALPGDCQLHLASVTGLRDRTKLQLGEQEYLVTAICRKSRRVEVNPAVKGVAREGAAVFRVRELAESTLLRWLAPLSAAFTLGVKRGWCRSNPCTDRKALGIRPLRNQRFRALTEHEEARLLEVLGELWWPYIQFAVLTGMRWSNQFGLQWADVFMDRQMLVLQETKSGRQQVVPLSPLACEVLRTMRLRFPDSAWCFPSATGCRMHQGNWDKRHWRPALRTAGIQDLRWHDLRRTAACRLITLGHSLFTVKTMLGHQSSQTTERHYAAMADAQLRTAMTDLGGTVLGGFPPVSGP